MESHAKYMMVGLVVTLLLGMLIGAVIWLQKKSNDSGASEFLVYFKEHSLSGLQVDSVVTMRGIKVGNVKSLRIVAPDIERVEVKLKIQSETPIKTDTQAVVVRNLLTGLATIDLINSTQDAPNLTARGGHELPVIPEGQSRFDALTADLPRFMEQAGNLFQNASGFLSDENKKSVSKILHNIETVSGKLAAEDSNISKLVQDLDLLAKTLQDVALKFEERSAEIGRSLDRTTLTLSLEARSISRDVNQVSQSLSAVLEKFEDPASLVAGPSKGALGPGESHQGGGAP